MKTISEFEIAAVRQKLDLPRLPGYANSRPVRIGNSAHLHLLLDGFGELLNSLHQSRSKALTPDIAGCDLEKAVLEHLEAVWVEPDQGIWEVRSEPRQVTYSKVVAWVAFDRAIKSAEAFKLDRPIERWRTARIIIRANVIENGFDPTRGSFVSAYGSHERRKSAPAADGRLFAA